ncbi:type IV secretory system conjugative DNA transfer family protein [Bradyrhizobium sp. F1.13.3]|uniref:type IV secretory system conjugative DNA transfer family protein n=1 Tax=Bradyrhizobium sp. F1.13.3 TaxID=3156351 RepID=UPI0033981ADC
MLNAVVFVFVGAFAFVLGYPCAAAVAHGLNPAAWPPAVMSPDQWLQGFLSFYALPNAAALLEMATGHSPAFAGGGLLQIFAICSVPIAFMAMLPSPKRGPRRDPDALQGDARWATKGERSTMKKGLEFGRDCETGKPIRVAVEGNILTIAPPRRRKTSGLIIPNLVAADKAAWNGPAVVLDPKGQVYRAVVERRQALGKTVRCLDPMAICGGTDRWNPLTTMNPADTAYLQRVARTLLPSAVSEENAYFQNKAADVIVAAFQAAQHLGNATPLAVSDFLSNPDQLADALKGVAGTTANRVRQFLTMDAKTRDPILSTAQQAFQWCDDERMQALTSDSTFALTDLCAGDTDLFVTLPTENLEALAPFLRWLLADLFATIRRNRVAERLIIFVDETRTLGNCRELITAAGELPGAGASLWTFWQDRSQIMACYGAENGATLLRTSEFVTVSDPAMVDPDEREFWSRALSDFTVLEETKVNDKSVQGARTSSSQAPRGVRLMTAEELGRLPSSDLILFPNSDRYAKRAVRLRKTRHDDARFAGLTTPVAPVGATT